MSDAFDSVDALNYFKGRFKNSESLCCESIGVTDVADFEETFWLMNDNTLAIVALDRLGETTMRDTIKARLSAFQPLGHTAFTNSGWVDPFLHQEVAYLTPLKTAQCYRWNEASESFGSPLPCAAGMRGILQEEWNGSMYGDEENYFNLSASKALSWHKQFQQSNLISDRWVRDYFITRMELMWNSTNLGFGAPDQAGRMTTYYLAAYLLAGWKTGWPTPFDPNRRVVVTNTLNSLQQSSNGGFGTWYIVRNGAVVAVEANGNMETTSLAVCANIRPQDYFAF